MRAANLVDSKRYLQAALTEFPKGESFVADRAQVSADLGLVCIDAVAALADEGKPIAGGEYARRRELVALAVESFGTARGLFESLEGYEEAREDARQLAAKAKEFLADLPERST